MLEIITQKTARIGPDNHSAVNRDVDLFIIWTLNISKLPDYTQLEFFLVVVKNAPYTFSVANVLNRNPENPAKTYLYFFKPS